MLIYGDPSFEICFDEALGALQSFVSAAESGGLSEARELLAVSGQLEQAAADAANNQSEITASMTLESARIFLARLRGERASFAQIKSLMGTTVSAAPLRVKIPEGFAFYGVYPEQYVRAASHWAARQRPSSVAVVGIRSIGTSLSAVVAATLEHLRWKIDRITVRPHGHPFDRRVDLPPFAHPFALVVDEGPGMSGSSIAAVAKALGQRDVTILPSHEGEPGSAANDEVRRIWKKTPRIIFPELSRDWRASTILAKLREASERHLNAGHLEMTDLSAGAWRNILAWPGDPPFAAVNFERTKYLFRAPDGRAVLWKYAGFGAKSEFRSITGEAFARQATLAAHGFTVRPVDAIDGFTATEWISGTCLTPGDLDDDLLQRLCAYICAASGPAVPPNSAARLAEMVRANCGKSIEFPRRTDLPSAGDGRLAPHEWIRTTDGKILKTDVWGHDADHTCIGPQSILWDIASAVAEWRMNPSQSARLLELFARRGVTAELPELQPYLTAWQAFQIGLRWASGAL